MISRDLTLTITDTNVSLDRTIVLYRYDRGIRLNITLKSDIYDLKGEITKARALILRPNKKFTTTEITDVDSNGLYVLDIDDTWTDHLGEIGAYQVQLQLYNDGDDNPHDDCITIAPFTFTVKNPIGIPQNSAAYVDQAVTDNHVTTYAANLPTGDLKNGEYLETSWIGGDLITSGKLNKIESVIDYLVGASANHLTSAEAATQISNATATKADKDHTHSTYASTGHTHKGEYVEEALLELKLIEQNVVRSTYFKRIEVVSELPSYEDPDVLYLVRNE